jgi:hypothetical protein
MSDIQKAGEWGYSEKTVRGNQGLNYIPEIMC